MNTEDLKDNDDDIARLLKATGAREQLPENLRASWETQFRAALTQARRDRRRRYWRAGTGIAAVLLVAVLGWFMRPASTVPGTAEMVVRHVQGHTERLDAAGTTARLAPGQPLEPEDLLRTGAGYAALSYGDFELRLNRNTHMRLTREGVALLTGEIFVSGDVVPGESGLLVHTPHGDIRDIGTQFTVRLSGADLQATVREGSIELTRDGSRYLVAAQPDSARQVTVTPEGAINLADATARGPEWAWIHRAGAGFALEGASALAFLEWVSRETGRELVFTGDAARIYASTTLLRGDIEGMEPEQALSPVLATTDLVAQQPANQKLTISLQRP